MQANANGGGPAEGVRWDLSDLYADPDDPALEADLERSLEVARSFAARHRGRLASLGAAELADAVDAFEALQEPLTRAAAYAQLLFAADTSAPRHGALLQRVQERGTEIRNELLFFELEWVALDAERADALLADPALARRRHFLQSLRRYRPHVLSEPEERILSEMGNTGRHAFARLFDELSRRTLLSLQTTRVDECELGFQAAGVEHRCGHRGGRSALGQALDRVALAVGLLATLGGCFEARTPPRLASAVYQPPPAATDAATLVRFRDRAIDLRPHDDGVGHRQDRRRVEQDEIETRPKLLQDLVESR